LASSANRKPSCVPRTTRPAAIPTPLLVAFISGPTATCWYSHRFAHVVASIA
jgi:hypothetical protein